MEPGRFAKMKAAFERQGGIIDQSKDAQRYLDYKGANAITLNDKTVVMRPNPTTTEVFEEFIHVGQFRRGEIAGPSDKLAEIAAMEKLIRNREAYGIPNHETRRTIGRLRYERATGRDR